MITDPRFSEKKLIGITFSNSMAQANMEGRKTVTRRLSGLEEINENPDDWQFEWADFILKQPFCFTQKSTVNEQSLKDKSFYQARLKHRYGRRGDIMWMREKHSKNGDGTFDYATQYPFTKPQGGWKPSIHMPYAACRFWAEITSVRPSRLQDITDQDAIAEGIKFDIDSGYYFAGDSIMEQSASAAYEKLINSINGTGTWEKNPWVWRIEYKPII